MFAAVDSIFLGILFANHTQNGDSQDESGYICMV